MLERSNKDNAITPWLTWFAETVLDAQRTTLERVEFYIAKTHFYDRLRGQLNPRQEKAIARMFREGQDGFKGGLSAENYISITQASRATATRDLQDLVAKGALNRTGERRYTRYHLSVAARAIAPLLPERPDCETSWRSDGTCSRTPKRRAPPPGNRLPPKRQL